MGLNKKIPKDGYFERDPFLGPLPLTNNNSGPAMVQACCDEKHKLKCSGKSHQLCTFNTFFVHLKFVFQESCYRTQCPELSPHSEESPLPLYH